jgi:hypothetical protein
LARVFAAQVRGILPFAGRRSCPSIVDALFSADLFGVAPAEVLLVGIQPETYDIGCCLSEPVKASLIAIVLSELDRLGIRYTRREQASETAIWWAASEKAGLPVTL